MSLLYFAMQSQYTEPMNAINFIILGILFASFRKLLQRPTANTYNKAHIDFSLCYCY